MFTGLIRKTAYVKNLKGDFLTLKSDYRPKIGDSIAVNGICLTVVKKDTDSFTVEISPETKSKVAFENLKGEVHMEPAMKLDDRLEGHIVQGHIDTVGVIIKIVKLSNATDFYIKIPKNYIKFVIPKGSVAIDGISLTVNDVIDDTFRITIIPHTFKNTLFSKYKQNSKVNIETDMFARYLYHMFGTKNSVTWQDIDSIMASY